MEPEIAAQMIEHDVNVMFGGGLCVFIPQSHPSRLSYRRDERDLLQEAMQRGYRVTINPDELPIVSGERVLGLYGLMGMLPADSARPSLVEMTSKSLELLSHSTEGFCLMVEGSQIDWRCHVGDFEGALWETLEFDRAVECCLRFAEQNGETLVVVTADHETGGLGLCYQGSTGISGYWASGHHTAIHVPLFAYGPGCLQFTGVYENIDVPVKIATVLGLDDFPALRARQAAGRSGNQASSTRRKE
jgi:alkaline phosphatase